eukprot:TRINITY_DN4858_c0_g1_i1.p1 TRINITY_DN4858_c0_g1~~TRINITY_DN4858_c0_g1_i1.p1  ORF type:complete len:578 (+),score=92.04 TRINITY_DN4858_c0_g1_i1:89-1822(+)
MAKLIKFFKLYLMRDREHFFLSTPGDDGISWEYLDRNLKVLETWTQVSQEESHVKIKNAKGEQKVLEDNESGVWSCNIPSLLWVDPNHTGKSKELHSCWIESLSKRIMVYDVTDDDMGIKILHLLLFGRKETMTIDTVLSKIKNVSVRRQLTTSPVFFAGNIGRAPTHPGKDRGGVIIFQLAAALPVAGCYVFSALARSDPDLQTMLSGHDMIFHHCSSPKQMEQIMFNHPFGEYINCKLKGNDILTFTNELLSHINNNRRVNTVLPLRFFHIDALKKAHESAKIKSDIAEAELLKELGSETLNLLKEYIRSYAAIHINLKLSKVIKTGEKIEKDASGVDVKKDINKLLIELISVENGEYLNQFESGNSGGSKDLVARKKWEENMFGQVYNDARVDGERPKYGSLNVCNAIYGFQKLVQYGMSYFILKNDVRSRCTVTSSDSCFVDASSQLGTLDYSCHILQHIKVNDPKAWAMVLDGCKKGSFISSTVEYKKYYIEVQIHGTVDINRDVSVLFIAEDDMKRITLNQLRAFQKCFPNVEIRLEGKTDFDNKTIISADFDKTSDGYRLLSTINDFKTK